LVAGRHWDGAPTVLVRVRLLLQQLLLSSCGLEGVLGPHNGEPRVLPPQVSE